MNSTPSAPQHAPLGASRHGRLGSARRWGDTARVGLGRPGSRAMTLTPAACAAFRVPALRCVAGAEASTSRTAVSAPSAPPSARAGPRVRARWMLRSGRRATSAVTSSALKRAGPTTPKPQYSDGPIDRELLRAFHSRVASELGEDPSTVTGDYDATMRACVRLVSSARTPAAAQARGERVLRSLLPRWFPGFFGLFIALFPSWFVARHAAAVTPMILPWLVGPARVIDAPEDLPVDDKSRPPSNAVDSVITAVSSLTSSSTDESSLPLMGEAPGYRQGVLLERCRVLEEGGCASVCLNVCKVPTQNFFNEIGLDVELRPDYETFECRFVYGKKPPEMTSDPAFDTPCFAQCPISKMNGVGTGSVERGKNAGMNLPRWAMDGDGGERDLEKVETVDGEAAATSSANGRGSNCDRLPEFTGDPRRNHGGGMRGHD